MHRSFFAEHEHRLRTMPSADRVEWIIGRSVEEASLEPKRSLSIGVVHDDWNTTHLQMHRLFPRLDGLLAALSDDGGGMLWLPAGSAPAPTLEEISELMSMTIDDVGMPAWISFALALHRAIAAANWSGGGALIAAHFLGAIEEPPAGFLDY